jgi:hypothetical protein
LVNWGACKFDIEKRREEKRREEKWDLCGVER